MFWDCTALSSAGEMVLSSIGIAKVGQYGSCFIGCTSLTSAPYFRETSLTSGGWSYFEMFKGCSKLAQISVSLTAWPSVSTGCQDWVNNVSSYGTFYCPTALGTNATIARGNNRCPTNWTVVNTDA